ncbi:hypothetical protein ASPZODRAFT_98922 [Penicilliopsis zonata CBS 506.65]|uniref:O-methyltransferase C-terminal domain-containing protein n=1 Tax=Penicilliopsis zonata CBS 506.65 TaxID=1073090 RepID=A0A1L9SFL8_9EURO|nr:hypothetical protein ASPZODRAFT_98922 [Penicilliopsis zonata CBS 506.65]OJJ45913.1 hypothetical protein ASPZODRAFT_98922 [Penicilliopsis zonata CBS 506.65]
MEIQNCLAKVQELATADASPNASPDTHRNLLQAIRALQLAAETPNETTSRLDFQIVHNIAIRVAVEKRFLHEIVAEGPVSASRLAEKTDSDELFVARILRMLCAIGFCDEVEGGYAPNQVTRFKTLPGSIAAEKHHFDIDFPIGGQLVKYMRGSGIDQFGESGPTIFKYAHGTHSIFGLIERDTEHKEAFDTYMTARRLVDAPQWFDIFPAEEKLASVPKEGQEVLLVDIGGGAGHELAKFHARFPHLSGRLILQDLPLTLDRFGPLPGIEKMEHDFFLPQPIKGARVYYLRSVLHDWSDKKSEEILSHIVNAMTQDSLLIIDDFVLPDSGADLRGVEMDILMWLHTAGLERTASQWRALLTRAGLDVVHIWDAKRGVESVLECRLRAI